MNEPLVRPESPDNDPPFANRRERMAALIACTCLVLDLTIGSSQGRPLEYLLMAGTVGGALVGQYCNSH